MVGEGVFAHKTSSASEAAEPLHEPPSGGREGVGGLSEAGVGEEYPSAAFWARDADVLPSGQVPGLCLWAVELRIRHPITDEELVFVLPDEITGFEDLLASNGGVDAAAS